MKHPETYLKVSFIREQRRLLQLGTEEYLKDLFQEADDLEFSTLEATEFYEAVLESMKPAEKTA